MSFNNTVVITNLSILIAAIIAGYVAFVFNEYIRYKTQVQKSAGNINVLLQQRFDELPKLVAAVRGYMKYESEVLAKITNIRASVMSGGMGEKGRRNAEISRSLASIFAISEKYPVLKANINFLALQKRISELESKIADSRIYYNDAVTGYNNWLMSFPNNFIARIFKARTMESFAGE